MVEKEEKLEEEKLEEVEEMGGRNDTQKGGGTL